MTETIHYPSLKELRQAEIHKALKALQKTMRKWDKFGAEDTEPRAVVREYLRVKLQGKNARVPRTVHDWELFSDMKGVGLAAAGLTRALLKCERIIAANSYGLSDWAQEYLEGF